MSAGSSFERAFKRLLPSPLSIALVLTLVTFLVALVWGQVPSGASRLPYLVQAWREGLYTPPLVVFLVQMMLILVLGHTLALAPPVKSAIQRILRLTRDPATATALTCFFTLAVGLFNWGLGLVFGAILARQMAEHLSREGRSFHYGLLGAAGYSGMLIWHGGFSGSAPVKVAEPGHLLSLVKGQSAGINEAILPQQLPLEATLLSPLNLTVAALVLILLPLMAYGLAQRAPRRSYSPADWPDTRSPARKEETPQGAARLDHSPWVGLVLGLGLLSWSVVEALQRPGFSFLTPNFINFTLLGLGLSFHRSLAGFSAAVSQAIGGAAGILIQFPLYFGIMSVMKEAGLITQLSSFFSQMAGPTTFPLFTFLSAAIINVFVPSGGGQWAIQGPVIIETTQNLGIDLGKTIMAMAYGDELTNMLQPFWALPLLGITGLKAREIIPYTLAFMLLGGVIFVACLLMF
ncbi:MAG: TIGR00366 family protein [Schleiferiaceae bacterium]|nr:TIGR00366 family protein [Schleiferiaceae bacterium]